MIKINLLPVKRTGKKSRGPVDETLMQLGVGMAVVVIVLGACGYRWNMLDEELTLQTQLKESKTAEAAALKKKVEEVESFEKKKLALENQVRIIEQLRKNQGGPVRLLDHLSQSLDPLKVWLSSVDGDAQVTVAGKALTNDDIVAFVKNLQESQYFSSVVLQESVQALEDGTTVYSFRLVMAVKG